YMEAAISITPKERSETCHFTHKMAHHASNSILPFYASKNPTPFVWGPKNSDHSTLLRTSLRLIDSSLKAELNEAQVCGDFSGTNGMIPRRYAASWTSSGRCRMSTMIPLTETSHINEAWS